MTEAKPNSEDQHAQPREIWEQTVDEGERRLQRDPKGLAATVLVGGLDVMLGLTAVTVVTGAMLTVTNADLAHVVGSLFFGIALVLVTIGRSELFTENFLVPVGAVFSGRGSAAALVRMWSITLVFNLVGLTLLSAVLAINGVLPAGADTAVGDLAQTFADRDLLSAFASALVGGLVMTLLTWLALAATADGARIALAMLIGFLLLAPSLNHAVVGFGEVVLALFSGTSHLGAWDFAWHEAVAILGNLAGGFAFVTATRLVQVKGEPD
ncbi:hypothetical protein BH10ACT11_BH10ACT11_02360 [soil metagenome]